MDDEPGIIKHIQSIQAKLIENEKKIEKLLSKGETDETLKMEIMNSLNQLNTVEINKNILKVTRIGITVNKLTKINNEEIKKLAEPIVQKWKEIAIREKNASTSKNAEQDKKRKSYNIDVSNASSGDEHESKKKQHINEPPSKKHSFGTDSNSNVDNFSDNSKTADKNGLVEVTGKNRMKSNESEVIDVEKINDLQKVMSWSYEGILDNDVHRDKAKHFLFKAFITGASNSLLYIIDKAKVNDIICNVENELYTLYVKKKNSQREYNMQLKSIKFNLGDKKNPDFNEKIYNNNITPQALAVMNSQDMASEEKKNEREKCLKESLIACQSDWDVKNILLKKNRKGEFQCFKCKGYDTIYNQLQTRSSDEPMTTFVTCLKCNNRWKF